MMRQELLDFLNAGMCLVDFEDDRYDIIMFWLMDPKHPGHYGNPS
jgi:hypothetical protein